MGWISPSIPLLEDKQQAFKALMQAQSHELFFPTQAKDNSILFGVKPPPMHLHVLKEPELVSALQALGATTRQLGPNAMQTASLELARAITTSKPFRPLNLVGLEANNIPMFTLVA